MKRFPCPYLGGEVELTEERERHIAENHPDLLPEYRDKLATALADPDEVRKSARFAGARMFVKWHDDLRGGKVVSMWSLWSSQGPHRPGVIGS